MAACKVCGVTIWGINRLGLCAKHRHDHERARWRARYVRNAGKRKIAEEDPEDAMTDAQIEAAVQASFDKAMAEIRARRRAA